MKASEIDDLIRLAVDAEDEALLAIGDGEEHVFSERYRKNMEQLFREAAKKPRRDPHLRKRIAAAILVAVLLIGSMTAGAFWPELLSFFQSINDKYTELRIGPAPTPQPIPQDDTLLSWGAYWYPDYLPEGYAFASATGTKRSKKIVFSSVKDNTIVFEQSIDIWSVSNDNEGESVPDIAVKKFETYALEKPAGNGILRTLAWTDGTYTFRLISQLSFEELVKIAEQVKYYEVEGN